MVSREDGKALQCTPGDAVVTSVPEKYTKTAVEEEEFTEVGL